MEWLLSNGFFWGNIYARGKVIGRVEMTYDSKALLSGGEAGNEVLKTKLGQPIYATEELDSQRIYLAQLIENAVAAEKTMETKIELVSAQPIVLTGKEFGDFDTSTKEGKTALREKAFEHLKGLAENNETVFCQALNANVEFSVSSAKKYTKFSSNPVKSKLAIKIKELIASGRIFKESEKRYDKTEQKNELIYHYLKNSAFLDEQEYGVRMVIREDSNGHFHYDLQINDEGVEAIMDSVEVNKAILLPVTKRGLYGTNSAQSEQQMNGTPTLDDVSSGYVLNLFVFDKEGNPIPDEETGELSKELENEQKLEETVKTELSNNIKFLQDVIDGKIDLMEEGVEEPLEKSILALGEAHELVLKVLELYTEKLSKFSEDVE